MEQAPPSTGEPDAPKPPKAPPGQGGWAFLAALLAAGVVGALWLGFSAAPQFYAHYYTLTEVLLGVAAGAAACCVVGVLLGTRLRRPGDSEPPPS